MFLKFNGVEIQIQEFFLFYLPDRLIWKKNSIFANILKAKWNVQVTTVFFIGFITSVLKSGSAGNVLLLRKDILQKGPVLNVALFSLKPPSRSPEGESFWS